MGILQDLTSNPQLLEMAGKLGASLLERRRKEDFDAVTADYEKRVASVGRQNDKLLSVDALERMREADLAYVAQAGRIGRAYEENAKKLVDFNNKGYQTALDSALLVAQQKDREFIEARNIEKGRIQSAIINDPQFAEFQRFKRSLTANQLAGEKGKQLATMQANIRRRYDPNNIAGLETNTLFETVPVRQVDYTGYGFAVQDKQDLQRFIDVIGRETNVKINVDEARRIRQDRNALAQIMRQKGVELTQEQFENISTNLQKDLAAQAGRRNVAEIQANARLQAAQLAADKKLSPFEAQALQLELDAFIDALKLPSNAKRAAAVKAALELTATRMAKNGFTDSQIATTLKTRAQGSPLDANLIQEAFGKANLDDVINDLVKSGRIQVRANGAPSVPNAAAGGDTLDYYKMIMTK